jgi:hypothetical protein
MLWVRPPAWYVAKCCESLFSLNPACFVSFSLVAPAAVCPNSCSGHGTCQNAVTFARDQFDAAGGEPSNTYNSVSAWDSQKMYGCKCESGYRGPDCSMKECPSSADPQGGPDGTTTYLDTDNGGIQRREPRDCSGRGKCDYTSGNCLCFKGFFGEDCSLQTALV